MVRIAEIRVRRSREVISPVTWEVVADLEGGRKEPPNETKISNTERGCIKATSYWTSKITVDSVRDILRITTPRGRTGDSGGSPAFIWNLMRSILYFPSSCDLSSTIQVNPASLVARFAISEGEMRPSLNVREAWLVKILTLTS